MDYIRQQNENIKSYKIRLFENKDTYNLNCQQIADLINKETGDNRHESTYRKWWNAYNEGRTDVKYECITEDAVLKEYEIKRVEFEKEKIKFYDQRTAYNKTIRDNARLDELKNIISSTIKIIEPYKTNTYIKTTNSTNDLLIGLNDIHFGIEINNYWNIYDSKIAKERLSKYLCEIINIKELHNSEDCYIACNGDLVSGNIHYTIALANKENVVEQVMGVSELISWFLSELSKYFINVYFSVVAGNHSRLSIKENSPKNERLDDLIPFYIKARLQNFNNIIVLDNTIDNTMSLFNIRGLNYIGVHGDIDKVDSVLKLVEMLPCKVYGIIFGHLHHNSSDFIQGYKTLMSGSLMGVDDYCIERRLFSKAQQLICVCDDQGVRCMYDVILQ